MKNYMGEELQLWIGTGETAHTLACATSLSVNVNADTIDVSCKDTGKFGASIAGKINWDFSDGKWGGSHGGHYMSTFEFLKFNNLL